MKRLSRRGILVAGLVALLAMTGCGESERSAPGRPAAGPSAGAHDPNRVALSREAILQAGIQTEVIRPAPFAVTLSLPARLSPVPESAEELEARLVYQSAEARYRRASSELERSRKLATENVVASKAVQGAEAEFAQAKVDRLRAETALRNLGIDGSREAAFPAADFWALAEVYDQQVPQVKAGAKAWVRVESFPDEPFAARVVSLARFLKPQTRTLTARIAIQDPQHRLRPQEVATAEIRVSERSALSVPVSALLYEGVERVLFVKHGESFVKIRVKAGAQQAGRVEILEGIADGDEVVTRGAQLLFGELYRTGIPSGDEEDAGKKDDDEDSGGR